MREREREREFANSANRPTSDFAVRISFRFLANGWLHGVYPVQEGWKHFWYRAESLSFRAAVTTTNHREKSPQSHLCVCVCVCVCVW